MYIRRWTPANEMMALQHQIGRLLGETLEKSERNDLDFGAWMPPVDMREEADKVVLEMEIPGIKKEDIEINIENSILTVRGEKKFERDEKKENYHKIERAYGKFSRSFSLPAAVKTDAIDATLKDGVLALSLPYAEEAKPKKITIKS